MSKSDLRRQMAAQNIREAREILHETEDKSFGDYILILGLAVIEEALSRDHD